VNPIARGSDVAEAGGGSLRRSSTRKPGKAAR
jgi:hypothetical protein